MIAWRPRTAVIDSNVVFVAFVLQNATPFEIAFGTAFGTAFETAFEIVFEIGFESGFENEFGIVQTPKYPKLLKVPSIPI